MVGDSRRTCLWNGSWSAAATVGSGDSNSLPPSAPLCRYVDCGPLPLDPGTYVLLSCTKNEQTIQIMLTLVTFSYRLSLFDRDYTFSVASKLSHFREGGKM